MSYMYMDIAINIHMVIMTSEVIIGCCEENGTYTVVLTQGQHQQLVFMGLNALVYTCTHTRTQYKVTLGQQEHVGVH